MIKLPKKEASLLKPDGFEPQYPKLGSSIEVDTVIVGGGITGITCAYLLKKAGQKVAVLEKDAIGSGTTGHTTGKVTSQHNLVYADMYGHLGEQKTRLYGQANQTAVEEIAKLIKSEMIDCGFERADNYVYTADPKRVSEFKREAKIADRLGLPASFERSSPLPFKIIAAVKFANQGHFSAQKYIEALTKKIVGKGSHIYEQTRAMSFSDGQPCAVGTSNGEVVAKNIIVATNVPTLPLVARVAFCVLEYPQTSYLIAGSPKIKLSGGMYISPDEDHYSLLPVGKGKDQILLVGGENHIRGHGIAKNHQQKLADYADSHFGMTQIKYRWHAWDYLAYDNVPLIGRLYPWSKNLYVATAFKKWGLSHSMVAGMLLRDLILGESNPWEELYSPQRLSPITSIPRTIAQSIAR
jgi:glycine/D-amino acid oxidase-like deaminating enzyme